MKKYIKLYNEIYFPLFCKNLKKHGVKKISCPTNTKISQSSFVLLYLIENLGKVVSKKELTEKYIQLTGIKTNDLQAGRHLGTQHGYDITNSRGGIDGYKLNSLNVRKGFISNRRNVEMTDGEWENLKNQYNYKCATCGDIENKPTRYDIRKICKLQMGHMNPNKPLTLDNTIPQCADCNSQYKNKYQFNKYGRITNVNKTTK
jgi:hypothetical protein